MFFSLPIAQFAALFSIVARLTIKILRILGIGHWEWGIGDWEWGIGDWLVVILAI
jgi:hypothetical protein